MPPFQPARLIDRLEAALPVFPALCRCAGPDARRKPPPTDKHPNGAWSVLEIACHMLDEEVDDFRARLRLTIESPGTPWPRIDPEARAVTDRYNERDLSQTLDRWTVERKASITWLRSLPDSVWRMTYQHPKIGPVEAGILLCSWPAHDALHIRQVAKRLFELSEEDAAAGGFKVDYAGAWGA